MKKNKFSRTFTVTFAMAAACYMNVWAGPISTVPWNGHDGAVSFTFDDGYNQLDALSSYLNSNSDVKVTFFITGAMGAGNGDMSGYLNMAKNGHEIGNHSKSHKDMTGGVNLSDETSGWKSSLLQKGASEVYSFATPFCASNANVANAINNDHIANRNCAGAKYYGWNSEPDWMDISSNCYTQGGGSTGNAKNNMGSAKSQKAWTVQLNHGVGVSDTYGIATNDMTSIMDEAKTQGLWIAPFGVVAAYYRAHFTLDKAMATVTATGSKYSWTSPHSAMPKSVMMKVKIDGAAGKAVSQKGKVISPNADGTFTIDFMALELEVSGEPPEVKPFKGAIEIPGTIEAENYDTYAYSRSSTESGTTGYRSDDAGIVAADVGNALGYTTAGDYFEYTLDVKQSTKYKVTVRGATGNAADGSVTIEVGSKTAKVPVVSKGDWDVYSESEGDEIEIAAGKQTIRLTINDNYLNVDNIKLEIVSTAGPAILPGSSSSGLLPASSNSGEQVIPGSSGAVSVDPVPGTNPGTIQNPGDITAIAGVRLNVATGMVKCQIFDMNGLLVKSADVSAGSARDVWNLVNTSLSRGQYIMRFGVTDKSMQAVRVRK